VCTLTIIPLPQAADLRIACNRDESRARPPARPPELRRAQLRTLIMPVDPVSDGTWIGVNDAGLAAALLNAYPAGVEAAVLTRQPPLSRGTIIPTLLGSSSLDELVQRATAIDTSLFAPFRLVFADRREVVELRWAQSAMELKSREPLTRPMMFTSSGMGDELVDPPRRELFRGWFHSSADWPAEQDAFHRHSWPEAPELSVCMSRSDARTVSFTVVEVTTEATKLSYFPQPPNLPSAPVVVSVALK
jgi:uncharacterized protein with NRDE domain